MIACRFLFLSAVLLLPGCYIEGSSCSGPFCVSVATEVGSQSCGIGCDQRFQCPDADVVRVLSTDAINQARQSVSTQSITQSSCGLQRNLSTVVWNEILFAAADRHARDMASNNFVDPIGSDGLSVADRVSGLDSSLTNASQLVAGGFSDPQALINAWLRLTEECSLLRNESVSQFAMACRYDENSDFGTYWSLVLADQQ